jgi:hypothetical protein
MKKFKAVARVHPINGGDDQTHILELECDTKEEAAEMTKDWLKKRSDVQDDFILFATEAGFKAWEDRQEEHNKEAERMLKELMAKKEAQK